MKPINQILLSAGLVFSVSGLAHALPQYALTDLGSLGSDGTFAYALNATGSVVGDGYNGAGYDHAFLYNGAIHDLGTLGGDVSYSSGINAAGNVVGGAYTTGLTTYHAFLYNGAMHDLGTLGGSNSQAGGINSSGSIVGDSQIAGNGANHAFSYSGSMHDLGTLGGSNSWAEGINDSGVIVGSSQTTGDGATHAFIYDGSMHDLGMLLGATDSRATGINASGQVIGYTRDNINYRNDRSFFYDGSMHDIGTLGGSYAEAYGINDAGHIVGASTTSDGVEHPFFFDGTTMVDVNSLLIGNLGGIKLLSVTGINDLDQMAGYGSDGRAYLLSVSSVPVPAAAWLFGSGLIGLVGASRKRKAV